MRTFLVVAAVVAGVSAAQAESYGYGGYGTGSNTRGHSVQGSFNNNGSYTQPHYRSNPNNTQLDNYSTRGNTNPFTGSSGTRSPRF